MYLNVMECASRWAPGKKDIVQQERLFLTKSGNLDQDCLKSGNFGLTRPHTKDQFVLDDSGLI